MKNNPFEQLVQSFKGSRIPKPEFCDRYVTVFSHPRSGTHFMEAFLAENFYKNIDLNVPEVEWGHWANRKINEKGNKYGKLFGSHIYPKKSLKNINYPIIYIYRDGRAAAYSIWKTENFIHPKHKGVSFHDFLRLKLDWKGTPGNKNKEILNIAEHWNNHVQGWLEIAKNNTEIFLVRYEDLIDSPYNVYLQIHSKFFEGKNLLSEKQINPIKKAVGLLPNEAKKSSWKDAFSEEDDSFFKSHVNLELLSKL